MEVEEDPEDQPDNYQQYILKDLVAANIAISDLSIDDMVESINLLSRRDKKIVTDFLINGYSQEEIAQELKTNSNNIKQRFFNAIRVVRKDLIKKFDIDETYFSKDGLLDIQKDYRRKSSRIETNYKKKFKK